MIRADNVLTAALTLSLLMVLTGLGTAQPKAAPRGPLEKPAQAVPSATMTGTVTAVDNIAKTFTVNANGKHVTFSAPNVPLPRIGESVEVISQGGRGGMLLATTVKGSKSNSDNRAVVTGKVTQVDPVAKTFTLVESGKQVKVDAANIAALPKVGDSVEVTHSGVPGGALFATTVKSSKSNSSD
jgi:hypothetical protein